MSGFASPTHRVDPGVFFTLKHPTLTLTLDTLKAEFALTGRELGQTPVIQQIDHGAYMVRLAPEASGKMRSRGEWTVDGPFDDGEPIPAGRAAIESVKRAVTHLLNKLTGK